MTPVIYVFLNGRFMEKVIVVALAQDGALVGQHVSSDAGSAEADIQDEAHTRVYVAHYPDGYRVEWIEDPHAHPGVAAAIDADAWSMNRFQLADAPPT
jgi:hypothetical protein